MINYVKIEDIQPGAEFYEVFCVNGERPTIKAKTLVCNSGPIPYHYIDIDGKKVESSSDKSARYVDVSFGDGTRSVVSLRDRHIVFDAIGTSEDYAEGKVYNFHRWFKTIDDAQEFCGMIRSGKFDLEGDQKFYDAQLAIRKLLE